jgi:DNA-binding NtrC family response regulator
MQGVMGMKRILIIDDRPTDRQAIRIPLEKAGYKTSEASNGREAIKSIESNTFDLIILDVILPDTHGLKLLMSIRDFKPNVPVIVLTAYEDSLEAFRFGELGAFYYLTKPFLRKALIELVVEALEKKGRKKVLHDRQEASSARILKKDSSSHLPGTVKSTSVKEMAAQMIPYREVAKKQRQRLINDALKASDGNKTKAAGLLGMSRATLYRMLNKIKF